MRLHELRVFGVIPVFLSFSGWRIYRETGSRTTLFIYPVTVSLEISKTSASSFSSRTFWVNLAFVPADTELGNNEKK